MTPTWIAKELDDRVIHSNKQNSDVLILCITLILCLVFKILHEIFTIFSIEKAIGWVLY